MSVRKSSEVSFISEVGYIRYLLGRFMLICLLSCQHTSSCSLVVEAISDLALIDLFPLCTADNLAMLTHGVYRSSRARDARQGNQDGRVCHHTG